jgi:hypothetical protein
LAKNFAQQVIWQKLAGDLAQVVLSQKELFCEQF